MKPISECNWSIFIIKRFSGFCWRAIEKIGDKFLIESGIDGFDSSIVSPTGDSVSTRELFSTESQARENWKKFAEINGIKNYVFPDGDKDIY